MAMTDDKFRVTITKGFWKDPWPPYFDKFVNHCNDRARQTGWLVETVIKEELKPLGGRLIKTKTQGWYLRWDKESSHTFFVLRWS